jgi:PAS domain S-box-containing protein
LILDGQGRVIDANAEYLRISGHRTLEEILGRTVVEWTAPYDVDRNAKEVEKCYRKGFVRQLEIDYVHPDGKIIPIEINATCLDTEDGRRIVCLCRDITERREAQEALRASEERYDLAVRGAGVGIWDWDIRTGKLYFSPRWKAIFGYGENDIGDSLEDWAKLLHPDEKDWMPKFLEDFLAGTSPTITVEYRLRHKDGSYRWIVAHAVVVRDDQGKARRVVGSHGDITDRKQAEEALHQSHEELRAIYESLGDGLLVADRETLRLVRANAAICSMLGYSEEELLSMSIPALHPKETLASIVDPIQTGMVRHLPGKGNVPMLRKDGSVFYADITGDTFTYQGRPCSLGLFRDVTERRQAQVALERERRTLEHMLKASDHERQLIAYDIHDGLAQELAGAIMQFQIYGHQKDTKPQDAEKAFDGGVSLLRQAHVEARRLISGVRPPILDESGIMAAISHLIHDPAFEQGPKIEFHSKVAFSRLNPVVENVIYRIVQEGLTNARNHSKSEKIRVSLVQRGERLRIEVRDWGLGFDPKTVQENRFGVDGIRERARLLGGKCSIKSKPGEGTAVVVELPVAEQRQEE